MQKSFLFPSGNYGLYDPQNTTAVPCKGINVDATGLVVDLAPIRANGRGITKEGGIRIGRTHIQIPIRDLMKLLQRVGNQDLWPIEYEYNGVGAVYWNRSKGNAFQCRGLHVTACDGRVSIRAVGKRGISQVHIDVPWDDFDPFLQFLKLFCIRYLRLREGSDPDA